MIKQILPLFLLCFAACQSKQADLLFLNRNSSLPPRRQSIQGATQGNTAAIVREPEVVKVYAINRYVDSGDSRLMHERHAVYRLEQPPDWVTHSPRLRNEVILGPIVGLKKPEYAPEPLPGETARVMAEAKRDVQQAHDDLSTIRDGQAKVVSSLEHLASETVEAQKRLASAISGLNERVVHLEGGTVSEPAVPNANNTDEPAVIIHPSNR